MTGQSGSHSRWRFRPARPDDEPAVLDLFERSFGWKVTPEFWRWKLNPAQGHQSWVGVGEDDLPVFHYGGLRCTAQIDDGLIPAMVAVDGFTAPEARRTGLLTLGARHIHQHWSDHGTRMIFGLPNERWGSRTAAVGFEELFELRWWIHVLRPAKVIARRLRLQRLRRAPRGSTAGETGRLTDPAPQSRAAILLDDLGLTSPRIPSDEELETLGAFSKAGARFRISQDHECWSWRFVKCSGWHYRVVEQRHDGRLTALAAVRIIEGGRTAVVAALDGTSSLECRRLLKRVTKALRSADVEIVMALAPAKSGLEFLLQRSGFLLRHKGFKLCVVPTDPELPLQEMRDPRLWWLSGGDFDVA